MNQRVKKVVLAGGSGFVGQALAHYLVQAGYEVALLSRQHKASSYKLFHWQPDVGRIDQQALAWADAVVNLAGERITDGEWTPARKDVLIQSRIKTTLLLVEQLGRFKEQGKVFVSSSAYGYMVNRQTSY